MIAALTAAIALTACGTNRVTQEVIMPNVEGDNSSAVDITAVKRTDSGTVIECIANNCPNYYTFNIPGDICLYADGEYYPLISAEGVKPGKQSTLTDGVPQRFSLTFAPLPDDVEKVDMLSRSGQPERYNYEPSIKIWGIDLTGKRNSNDLPAGVPDIAAKPDLNGKIPEARLDTGVSVVTLHAIGNRPWLNQTGTVYVNTFEGHQNAMAYTLKNDTAQLHIPMAGPAEVLIITPEEIIAAQTVAPGEDINIYLLPVYHQDILTGPYSRRKMSRSDGIYNAYDVARDLIYPVLDAMLNSDFGLNWRLNAEEYTDVLVRNYKNYRDSIDAHTEIEPMVREYYHRFNKRRTLYRAANPAGHLGRLYSEYYGKYDDYIPADSLKFTQLTPEQLKRVGALFDTGSPDLLLLNSGDYYAKDFNWRDYGASSDLPQQLQTYRRIARDIADGKATPADIAKVKALPNPFFAKAAEFLRKHPRGN